VLTSVNRGDGPKKRKKKATQKKEEEGKPRSKRFGARSKPGIRMNLGKIDPNDEQMKLRS